MDHPSHKLSAYCADFKKRTVYCILCGKEEDEGLQTPCTKIFVKKTVDIKIDNSHTKFVSGLP